mmetsp:Transcript_773/g.2067  ORF Transcript_773/g.2067 Transcript_773/m.2067 type:complete len:296 (-) Transcript_773:61-948(-)
MPRSAASPLPWTLATGLPTAWMTTCSTSHSSRVFSRILLPRPPILATSTLCPSRRPRIRTTTFRSSTRMETLSRLSTWVPGRRPRPLLPSSRCSTSWEAHTPLAALTLWRTATSASSRAESTRPREAPSSARATSTSRLLRWTVRCCVFGMGFRSSTLSSATMATGSRPRWSSSSTPSISLRRMSAVRSAFASTGATLWHSAARRPSRCTSRISCRWMSRVASMLHFLRVSSRPTRAGFRHTATSTAAPTRSHHEVELEAPLPVGGKVLLAARYRRQGWDSLCFVSVGIGEVCAG